MKLTRLQHLALGGYLAYRRQPPRLGTLLLKLLPAYALLALLGALAAYLALRLGWTPVPWALVGLGAGVVLRDIGTFRRFIHLWPALQGVLDWEKLDDTLRTTELPPLREELRAAIRPLPTLRAGLIAGVLVVGGVFGGVAALEYIHHPARNNPPGSVVILTTDWCGYCAALRRYLQVNAVPYREIDTEKSWAGMLAFSATGARGVPVTVVGDEVIYGYSRAEGTNPIEDALLAAGYHLKQRISD